MDGGRVLSLIEKYRNYHQNLNSKQEQPRAVPRITKKV